MADATRNEPPRLHIAHHQPSDIRHTGVGEYQVTMSLRVEMVNTEKEIVHVQFLVDGTPQHSPKLLGGDGGCEETLVLAPATHPYISVLLSWRHDPNPSPIGLETLHVPAMIDPREQNLLEGMYIRRQRRLEAERQNAPPRPPRPSSWIGRVIAWFRESL